MATGLAKKILGILGPYYKDNENGSKQPVNLQSFFNLRDVRLASTPVILRTDDP